MVYTNGFCKLKRIMPLFWGATVIGLLMKLDAILEMTPFPLSDSGRLLVCYLT